MVNNVVLVGRLTRDPELRYTPSGAPVARFTLAVDRSARSSNGEKQTDFIRITCWEKQAELVSNYLNKGSLVGIEGAIRVNSVSNPDGTRREFVEVLCRRVSFLGGRRDSQPNPEERDFAGFGEVVRAPGANPVMQDDEEDEVPF